jgi:hypothetical protein
MACHAASSGRVGQDAHPSVVVLAYPTQTGIAHSGQIGGRSAYWR